VAANVQSDQGRFTVVKLPIVQIVLETLVLPYRHLHELFEYGWIPFVGASVARLVEWFIGRFAIPSAMVTAWMPIAHFVLFIPFSVVWTRIAIDGVSAKLPDRPFEYRRTEWQYALAAVVMSVTVMLLVGPALILYRYGQQSFQMPITALGTMLLAAGAILAGVVFVRFSFVFPVIVIGRYNGLGPAWRQTAGNFEGLVAIMGLAFVPYAVLNQIVRLGAGQQEAGLSAVLAALLEILTATMTVNANSIAPALAYKWIVLGKRG
jgi:hypothetical protein